MRISALEVATAILEEVKSATTDQDAASLAICLSRNNGAFRIGQTRAVWLVLGSVLAAGNADGSHPVVVATSQRLLTRSGALLPTEAVARTFRDAVIRDVGTDDNGCYPSGYRKSWAPALCTNVRPGEVSLGGAFMEPKETTVGLITADNEYAWYDLAPQANFPVGHVVFRIKANGVLVAYQRVQTSRWLCITATRPACPVPLASILERLEASEIVPASGRIPVVTTRIVVPGA